MKLQLEWQKIRWKNCINLNLDLGLENVHDSRFLLNIFQKVYQNTADLTAQKNSNRQTIDGYLGTGKMVDMCQFLDLKGSEE